MLKADDGATDLIKAVHETMVSIKSSITNAAILRNITELTPKINNDTRWSSKYDMIARYCRVYNEIMEAADTEGSSIKINEAATLTKSTKLKLQLEEINEVTKYLQTRALPLHLGRFALDDLEKLVEKNRNKPNHALYKCCFKLNKASATGRHAPDHHFESGVCKIQTGRHKELIAAEQKACECLLKQGNHAVASRANDSPVRMADRIKRMRNSSTTTSTSSPYHDCGFIFASSAEAERLWSLALHVFSTKRRSMTPRLMEAILYLQVNKRLWNDSMVLQALRTVQESKNSDRVRLDDEQARFLDSLEQFDGLAI